ncbi:RecQ family ATP-dependent DNA helicase [Alkalitalea saponilacus]|uniref:DNA 3'-5' helicase n=1 Tax=Alkalitalea saponilacus TaxID=889453 RepID=A0A1T5HSN6_9BACT|nr:RecQ family ATP-dependent DNA helicase [Alkalitalea saponilacus]ASB49224.1 ATP-binding protein [Alkalitalea saponilacus]SKC23708.1 ATP-dependent DNA helicase RecQ [Alkalitalea saponilacus]
MKSILFLDIETDPEHKRILDIGAINNHGHQMHSNAISDLIKLINDGSFLCGHNIIRHDLPYLKKVLGEKLVSSPVIDTLFLSPLLFPKKPYHALLKDDKLQTEELNNPLNDAIKAMDLFYDEVTAFKESEEELRQIFYSLLGNQGEFAAFFLFVGYESEKTNVIELIRRKFASQICAHIDLEQLICNNPIELAYCIALINTGCRSSFTPPWVLKNFPEVDRVMYLLRNNPCLKGCTYCDQSLDAGKGLRKFFGFEFYRQYGGKPLQEEAVKAAIQNRSLLAVFPTGGGKSITFQVPALMSGENVRGLTVIISPLQSLMKDQVDNLERAGITEAVTINGLLDPIERAKSFERVENGSASMLYISPESLRSKTIEHLLLGRNIVRFVIDEAHCFSAWGQDFRVDYLYIGDFIKSIQEKKNLTDPIPVSCFTATAKQKVIEDIKSYFREKLALKLELFTSPAARENLLYKVLPKETDEEKYQAIRHLVDGKNCPTIVYVSRTRLATKLAQRLSDDGYAAKAYHGKMDKQEKSENQDAFIRGDLQIMVATSAFGMGVDKKDVGMVIHHDVSDSLENYVQEAGRAGRDEKITAECYILFSEEDLSKHFILLNQTKLNIKEIQQIWSAIKEITRFRATASNSALEIARKAGWDENVVEIETRVTTAIAALEEAGYIRRGQNMPRIFANSILAKNAQEAIERINQSHRFNDKQKVHAVRIIKKLFSGKSRKQASDEVAETRIDYISDHLGIVKEEVINVVNLLREERILADAKDLTAFIKRGENKNRSLNILQTFGKIETFFLSAIDEDEKVLHLKELNEAAEMAGCIDVSPNKLRTIINFWTIKNWIKRRNHDYSNHHFSVMANNPVGVLKEKLEKRHQLAAFIVNYLFAKSNESITAEDQNKEQLLVEFSVHELKQAYEKEQALFKLSVAIEDVEDALFYLSRIDAIKIEGGFLVVYNKLSIERIEQDNKKRYKTDDYTKLKQFYVNKIQQIHIVGEYAKKMISDYKEALQFVNDYFNLNYSTFLNRYFNATRQKEIQRNLTPSKFRQLFGELSPSQLKIITDNSSRYIVVAAGPGSGKTKVLVHKLASLLLMEDVKHEQLLMITFSRAAASEFKQRLIGLIGNAAAYVEIKTFHSYCFDLLGKVGSIEKSDTIIQQAIDKIRNKDIEPSRISKSVLVIDEAQDMDLHEFSLIKTLMDLNEEMRVIAVGDDDQNIYEFRGASSRHLEQFITQYQAKKYELNENFRSKNNLVEFTNKVVQKIRYRLKETPIVARQKENGEIKVTKYRGGGLITPLVEEIAGGNLAGTTAVLTQTNDEALLITGLLNKMGFPARLIQSNSDFSLYNLYEIRFFIDQLSLNGDQVVISDDTWKQAKRNVWEKFKTSSKIDVCINLVKEFQLSNPKQKYRSDFEVFVRESKAEDFININGETIFVSTIHKAKGKEFDHVFLLLDNFVTDNDEKIRQLYVAMTRAKENLSIHLNGAFLDDVSNNSIPCKMDDRNHQNPEWLILHLTHKDIWLGYFTHRQHLIPDLLSGDPLLIDTEGCTDAKGRRVLKFSTAFKEKLSQFELKGYKPTSAEVNHILYWKNEDTDTEIKIILPEVRLGK